MDVVDRLPEDLYVEIFSRLPKKFRLRCEAVSKGWQNMMEKSSDYSLSTAGRLIDSGFVHINYDVPSHDSTTVEIKFYRFDDKGSIHLQNSLVFSEAESLKELFVSGSCKGFVYMILRKEADPSVMSHILYNPVTRHITTIPPLPPLREYDSFQSSIATGFAPDLDTNHYKFLLASCPRDRIIQVAIFSSETGEWKTLEKNFEKTVVWGGASLYCSKGSLYWLNTLYLSIFCMKSEIFRTIYLPEVARQNQLGLVRRESERDFGLVWESERSIHYCEFSKIHGICIWVLEEENPPGSDPNPDISCVPIWRKIYSLDMKTLHSVLAQAIKRGPHSCIKCRINIYLAYAFDEHLQILCLLTSHGFFGYDISGKTMTPLSAPDSRLCNGLHLPFTYNYMELPDINGTHKL